MNLLTIFTPTYNRAYILHRCYESLCRQTNMNFNWIIVDDGSEDNTEDLVSQWISDGIIDITYIKQENQGKMMAHNVGAENCKTVLFMCLDSDDYLTDDAVEIINLNWTQCEKQKYAGMVALRVYKDFSPVGGTEMPNKIKESTLIDLYFTHGFKGDTALIYRTEYLRKYPFPKISGEKFIPEPYVYDQIDLERPLFLINKGIYICEYLEDGYSANISNVIRKNPRGYLVFAKQRMQISKRMDVKLRAAAQYMLASWLSGEKHPIIKSPNKILTFISVPFALMVYFQKYRR